MNDIIKEDILKILKKTIEGIKERDSLCLKEISNHTIHNASIYQDDDSVSIAILVYATSKLLERVDQYDLFEKKLEPLFIKSKTAIENNDLNRYHQALTKLFDVIKEMDKKFRLYIQEVIAKGQINKASKLHEHGISIARSAEILGIDRWDLMSYVGKTTLHDESHCKVAVKSRVKFARSLFN